MDGGALQMLRIEMDRLSGLEAKVHKLDPLST